MVINQPPLPFEDCPALSSDLLIDEDILRVDYEGPVRFSWGNLRGEVDFDGLVWFNDGTEIATDTLFSKIPGDWSLRDDRIAEIIKHAHELKMASSG